MSSDDVSKNSEVCHVCENEVSNTEEYEINDWLTIKNVCTKCNGGLCVCVDCLIVCYYCAYNNDNIEILCENCDYMSTSKMDEIICDNCGGIVYTCGKHYFVDDKEPLCPKCMELGEY